MAFRAPVIAAPDTNGAQSGNRRLVGYVVCPTGAHPPCGFRRQIVIAALVLAVQVAASGPLGVTTGRVANGIPDNAFNLATVTPRGLGRLQYG